MSSRDSKTFDSIFANFRKSGVLSPINQCSGASFLFLGLPLHPIINKVFILYKSLNEVWGLIKLPIPAFCNKTTGFFPAKYDPEAIDNANPSFAAGIYSFNDSK